MGYEEENEEAGEEETRHSAGSGNKDVGGTGWGAGRSKH